MKRTLCIAFSLILASLSAPFFASALTVSPARLEISGDPGQTLRGEILLFEEAETEIAKTYYVSFENFEPRGDSGAPYFIGAKDGLATWISATDAVSVSSAGETKVPFTISIPSSAKPGGYFAAVFFGTQPPAGSGGQVSVGGKVGVLVLLRVNGEIEEKGGLLEFGLKGESRFVSTPPIILEYRLNNEGGDRVVPRGTITLLNTFRFKAEELNANKNEGSVLPGSARRFEVFSGEERPLDDSGNPVTLGFFDSAKAQLKDFKFGWYTAKLDIEWGETKQSAQDSYHFFVIPWQALIILAIGFFVVWKGFAFVLRRYNRWVLAQAGVHQSQSRDVENFVSVQEKKNKIAKEHRVTAPEESVSRLKTITKEKEVSQTKPLQKPRRKI